MRKVLLSRGPRSGMPRWQLFHHTSSLALHLNKGPASGRIPKTTAVFGSSSRRRQHRAATLGGKRASVFGPFA
jgi:hypothetical protein